jgi:chromosomal replication initiation ATPase DnaA
MNPRPNSSALQQACERMERAKREYYAAATAVRELLKTELREAERVAYSPMISQQMSGKIFRIVELVAEHHGIAPEDLLGQRRVLNFAGPRQIAMVLTRQLLKLSLERVGEAFRRDHGAVMWAEKAVRERCAVEKNYKRDLDELAERCRAELAKKVSP